MVSITGHQRRTFGDPIAVQNRHADRVEGINDILLERGTAADHELQLAAKALKNALKELAPQIDPDLSKRVADLHHAAEELVFPGFLGLSPDAGVQLFEK